MKKKNMRHFLAATVTLLMMIIMCACGASKAEAEPDTESEEAEISETAALEETAEPESEETAEESEDAEESEVPDGFTDGYEFCDYEKYTDASTSEDLKGALVWVNGAVTVTGTISSNGQYFNAVVISSEDGNNWVILGSNADSAAAAKKADYDYEKNGMYAKGVYVGCSDNIPIIVPYAVYVISTGEMKEMNADFVYEERTETAEESASESGTEVSADFKKTMDEYEAFFDEYVEFMEKYSKSDNPLSMMTDYMNFLTKYASMMSAMENIDEDSLSDADLTYYLEVTARIEQKLLIVSGIG